MSTKPRYNQVPPNDADAKGCAMHQPLKDLETPPKVTAEAQAFCAKLGLLTARDRRRVEEEIKTQYYFGGKAVAYLPTAEGRIIVAVGAFESEEFGEALNALTPSERCRAVVYSPRPWGDLESQAVGLLAGEGLQE